MNAQELAFSLRTQDDIVARMRKNIDSRHDIFGFEAEVMAAYLDAEKAKEFCKPDADLADWKADPLDREAVTAAMASYLSFAWGKCLDHRGLSASRSVQKLATWLWILGDDEAVAFARADENYPQYGAPVLAYISRRYGLPIPTDEAAERMANGLGCSDDCEQGCGR